ncbi:unnamed protein product [Rotaria sordida]|uniref:Uncharacterized protein n=1 Tax=Rotaria sordida TaxID=392033 RepID=A0A815XJF3_9BILA|nr:unnamed protein product [Rotaria sordida]CAF1558341.1 unnamed protein product [Rotaria sordida]
MAGNSLLRNMINQNDPKMEQQSKHRVLFDYSLSTPLHPPKPVWSSKRLDKMSSSHQHHHHHRASSTRPTRRILIVAPLHAHRSTSAPPR